MKGLRLSFRRNSAGLFCLGFLFFMLPLIAAERCEREPVFEFTRKPFVTRQGEGARIEFETKGFCDVTVAIEDAGGQIVRHLASGVLGPNAPEPFEKKSRR